MPSPNSAWPGAAISICACALKSQIQLYVEFKWWILVTTPEVRKFRCDDKRGGTATFRAQTTFVNSVCAEHVSARGGQPSAVGPWLIPWSTSTCWGMSVSRFPGSLYVETYKVANCFGVCDRSLADPAGYEHLFGTECRRFAGSSYVETYEVVKRFGVRERIPQNLARALYGTTYKCCHLSYRRSEISEPLNKWSCMQK